MFSRKRVVQKQSLVSKGEESKSSSQILWQSILVKHMGKKILQESWNRNGHTSPRGRHQVLRRSLLPSWTSLLEEVFLSHPLTTFSHHCCVKLKVSCCLVVGNVKMQAQRGGAGSWGKVREKTTGASCDESLPSEKQFQRPPQSPQHLPV